MPDVTPNSLARRIMERYDDNRDGKIDIRPGGPLDKSGWNEAHVNTIQNTTYKRDHTAIQYKQTTLISLFKDADTNNDGRVTLPELKRTLNAFDRNKNGIIGDSDTIKGSKAKEMDVLRSSYPEEVTYTTIAIKPDQKAYFHKADTSTPIYGQSPSMPSAPQPSAPQSSAPVAVDPNAERKKTLKAQIASLTGSIRMMEQVGRPSPGGIWGIDAKRQYNAAQPQLAEQRRRRDALMRELADLGK